MLACIGYLGVARCRTARLLTGNLLLAVVVFKVHPVESNDSVTRTMYRYVATHTTAMYQYLSPHCSLFSGRGCLLLVVSTVRAASSHLHHLTACMVPRIQPPAPYLR